MLSPSTVLLRTQTDERLVALARSGHDRAFDAIVERYRRPLLRACRRILPEARAEDALQQALVAAWRGLQRGDDVRELRPWLYRITRNTALNQLRTAGYDLDELLETLTAADDPEEEVLRRAVVRQTLAAVAALPDRQREALLRTAVSGHAQDDVARDLGLSSTAMRQLVHRARVSVRAAATALVPMPVATWLAAGAGGAGTAATIAKAGTVVVLAGSAVTAPALIEHGPPTPKQRAHAHASRPKPRAEATRTPAATATAKAGATATPARVMAPTPVQRPVKPRSAPDDIDEVREEETVVEHETSRRDRGSGEDGRHGHDDDEARLAPSATPSPLPEAEQGLAEQEDEHGGETRDGLGGDGSSGPSGEDRSGPGGGDEPED